MWGYIIDGVLIAIIVISAIVGIVKGLIDSVLGLISTGAALAAGVFGAKYVSNFVNKIFNLEEFILGKLDGGAEGTVKFFGGDFSNSEVAKFCVWIVTVVAIFLIVKLAIFILAKIFESVTQNSPTLTGINRVLGMVFGAAKGAIMAIALVAVASLLSEVPGIGKTVTEKIGETKVASFAYKYVDEFVDNNLTAENIQDIVDRIVSEVDDKGDTEGGSTEGTETGGTEGTGTEGGGTATA